MNIKQFCNKLAVLSAAASLGLAGSATAATDAELEAEAAKEFARIKATAPLTTDQDVIYYIACVANAVVTIL